MHVTISYPGKAAYQPSVMENPSATVLPLWILLAGLGDGLEGPLGVPRETLFFSLYTLIYSFSFSLEYS